MATGRQSKSEISLIMVRCMAGRVCIKAGMTSRFFYAEYKGQAPEDATADSDTDILLLLLSPIGCGPATKAEGASQVSE